jgi:hypothetical protein
MNKRNKRKVCGICGEYYTSINGKKHRKCKKNKMYYDFWRMVGRFRDVLT